MESFTLLGASEMDEALGGLVRYLSLLGAFVIAGNDIVKPIPGFTLYNVSDGIQATDIAGSVVGSIARTFTWNSSSLHLSPIQRRGRHSHFAEEVCSALFGFVTISAVIFITIFVWDWWGFANAISILISNFFQKCRQREQGNRVSCDELHIGREIEVQRFDETSGIDKRSRTYLRMDLSQSEEDAMLAWGLFPQRSNEGWWNRYWARTADTDRKSFDLWKGSFWTDQIPTSKERGQASYTTAVP